MQLERLDHVNVRTARLDEMVRWYEDVLGMKSGKRPPFPFPGAWLYVGDQACVHLIGIGDEAGADPSDLKLEHFAFRGQGLSSFVEKLEASGVRHNITEIAGGGLTVVNVWDPDGNHIHVDFLPTNS